MIYVVVNNLLRIIIKYLLTQKKESFNSYMEGNFDIFKQFVIS